MDERVKAQKAHTAAAPQQQAGPVGLPWVIDPAAADVRMRRMQCLHIAVQTMGPAGARHDRVLDAAKAFEAYINGDAPAA